ncbi:MAG: DUF4198 domain-containing protein [Candidatus Binatia bacterium]
MLMTKPVCTAMLLLALVSSAEAHYVWLERDGDGSARVYFGEWARDIREKAGGLLDRIKMPRAFLGASNAPLAIKRHDNHIEITVKGRGDLRLVENTMAPRDDKEKSGKTRTIYYAKTGRSETAAKLDLELVPSTADGNKFVVLFNGGPLPKAELTVYGPPKWEKKLTTDEQGSVTVPTPWAGFYVVQIVHFDETAGDLSGTNFDRTRHISSLSFVNSKGHRWPVSR